MVMELLRSAYQPRWRGRVVALDQTSRRRYFVPALKGGPHGEEALLRRLEPWDQMLRILRDARKSALLRMRRTVPPPMRTGCRQRGAGCRGLSGGCEAR